MCQAIKSKRNDRGAFYAIHSNWLGPEHINAMSSAAEAALEAFIYVSGKKAWDLVQYVSKYVKGNFIL